MTYTELHSGDSSRSARLSREVPIVASLRLAAAEILEAPGPPLGCLRLRSCRFRGVQQQLDHQTTGPCTCHASWLLSHLYAAKDFICKVGHVFIASEPLVGVISQACKARCPQ